MSNFREKGTVSAAAGAPNVSHVSQLRIASPQTPIAHSSTLKGPDISPFVGDAECSAKLLFYLTSQVLPL